MEKYWAGKIEKNNFNKGDYIRIAVNVYVLRIRVCFRTV